MPVQPRSHTQTKPTASVQAVGEWFERERERGRASDRDKDGETSRDTHARECWRIRMEDLRWACMSVNLRAVRSALTKFAPAAAQRRGRAREADRETDRETDREAKRPCLNLGEKDPLAGSTVLHFACNPAVGAPPRGHLPVGPPAPAHIM